MNEAPSASTPAYTVEIAIGKRLRRVADDGPKILDALQAARTTARELDRALGRLARLTSSLFVGLLRGVPSEATPTPRPRRGREQRRASAPRPRRKRRAD